jgi:hypothetical protein
MQTNIEYLQHDRVKRSRHRDILAFDACQAFDCMDMRLPKNPPELRTGYLIMLASSRLPPYQALLPFINVSISNQGSKRADFHSDMGMFQSAKQIRVWHGY